LEEIISYEGFLKSKFKEKILKFCIYRDRCHKEIHAKLKEMDVEEALSDEIIEELINEGALNEERYVRSFIRGKFRINKWGKIKIRSELKKNDISEKLITVGMEEIDETEYMTILKALITSKLKTRKETRKYQIRNKVKSYAYGKGFEPELAEIILQELGL